MTQPQSISIDNVEYVRKDQLAEPAQTLDGKPYVICRSRDAAVFAGYLVERNGREVELANARRIYYWDGAATLSQLAQDGTSKPDQCKFPAPVDRVELLEVCEVLYVTEKARLSIASVAEWVE
ncbi:MAG: hypothetical protein E6R03_16695 [Hyphomicrobiaceae bacterium]|nr:MAG: hypothetical protein E6R03_16695 [Hyphomicrobiaceae bacterium]